MECTPEELAALVLPGTFPNLLRRGSPAWATIHEAGTEPCVVVMVDPHIEIAHDSGGDQPGYCEEYTPDEVSLDLADATGCHHMGLWIDAQTDGSSGITWLWCIPPSARGIARGIFWAQARKFLHELDDLDQTDPRMLPNGFPWVDVEAGRRIAHHLAAGL